MPFDPDQLPMPDLGAMCRRCGYPLVSVTAHRCPECGWTFALDDLIPPGGWPVVLIDGRAMPITPRVRRILLDAQIPFQDTGILDTLYGGRTRGFGPNALRVPRGAYLDAAYELIHAKQDASGLEPERPTPSKGSAWTCPACGEENPSNFEICWRCQENRPAVS